MCYKIGILWIIFLVICANCEKLNETVFEDGQILTKILGLSKTCGPYENSPATQLELFKRLTDPCRYDRIKRPEHFDEKGKAIPLEVHVRSYVFYMQNLDTHNLQFSLQMRFQVRYNDPRLQFSKVGSNDTESIIGEEDLRNDLWLPHVFFVNEKNSEKLGTQSKDILTSIHPDGTVVIASRLQIDLYCSMNFRKFPFDQQECKTIIGNWNLNVSQVQLKWETDSPLTFGTDKILTEYHIVGVKLEETEIDATSPGLQYGNFIGNYSSISFKVILNRQIGYYLMEYYFPSILIIMTSWVSFWLQADQTPPRTLLGVTSMLTFITLSSSQTSTLPKVSYVKASEIWSISCTLFIFASLVEFAFVNLLWRRKRHLAVGKVSTTNILKKTLTPIMHKKNYSHTTSSPAGTPGSLRRFQSDTSLNRAGDEPPNAPKATRKFELRHSLSVESPALTALSNMARNNQSQSRDSGVLGSRHSSLTIESPSYNFLTTAKQRKADSPNSSLGEIVIQVPTINEADETEPMKERTVFTHQEIAILLDK